MNSAGGAVPYEMVLNLAPALGFSHSLLSANWDKAMGLYLFGRDQLAAGSCSVLNSGNVPHGMSFYMMTWDQLVPSCG